MVKNVIAMAGIAAVAAAQKKGGEPTYSCPKGYTLVGADCQQEITAPYQIETVTDYTTVSPETYCPKGTTMAGTECLSTTTVAKVAQVDSYDVPETYCPKGSNDVNGDCQVTRQVKSPVTQTKQVPAQTTEVVRSAYSKPATRVVSVAGKDVCPKGSTHAKGGGCVVEAQTTEVSQEEVERTVSVPVNTPVSEAACPAGTDGSGKKGCFATLKSQSVVEKTFEKSVTVAELAANPKTLTLPKTVLATSEVCPQGSQAVYGSNGYDKSKKGPLTCEVTLSRSVVKSYSNPKVYNVPVTKSVPKTLTLTSTSLVPRYSCPKGSTATGGQKGEELVCTVQLPAAEPTVKSAVKTVKVAKLGKKEKTVPVSRVESFPVHYCPKGSVETKDGACEVTVTLKTPTTVQREETRCPKGAEDSEKGCKIRTSNYVDPVVTPSAFKGKKANQNSYSCPKGATSQGAGPSIKCLVSGYEKVELESFVTSHLSYETETLTETVAPLVRYETQTVSEDFTTEEVYTYYEDVEVEETFASTVASSYTETVPALLSYETVSTQEYVTVSTDHVVYESCDGSKADKKSNKKHGRHSNSNSNGVAFPGAAHENCLAETRFTVETESYTEQVPAVVSYYTEAAMDQELVEESVVAFSEAAVTETAYFVENDSTTEAVEANQLLSFHTAHEPVVVQELRAVTHPATLTEAVTPVPSFTTTEVVEESVSEKLSTVSVPTTVTETYVTYETNTVVESVPAVTTYRTETSTSYHCPAGTVDTGMSSGSGKKATGCEQTHASPVLSKCPAGSSNDSNGKGCKVTTTSTVQSCPKGMTDNGKGCGSVRSVPAQVTYQTPAPTKKF